MTRPVYIVASPFKTGTSSIAQALVMLGAGHAPMSYRSALVPRFRPAIERTRALAHQSAAFAAFAQAHGPQVRHDFCSLMKVADGFDIFHDAPLGHSHIHPFALKVLLPNARFIWVKRPKKEWIKSVRHWETTHPQVYPDHGKWHDDAEAMIARKMRRRRSARKEFAALRRSFPHDTLVLEWSDMGDFSRLAGFCGVVPPTAPFPHKNRSGAGATEY